MQAGSEFRGENLVHQAVARDAVEALEAGGDDAEVEVRLAGGGGTGVAGVARAVIDDVEGGGFEGGREGVLDARGAGGGG